MKVCRRVWHTSQIFTLYLRIPCFAVNKSMFFTQILQKYLAISTGNHFGYIFENFKGFPSMSAHFMRNFIYLLSLKILKNEEVVKCTAHNVFLFYLNGYTSHKMLFLVKEIDV